MMTTRATFTAGLLAVGALAAPVPGIAHSDQAVMAHPWHPHSEFAVTTARGDFVLVVAPNLVNYTEASAAALAETARYCHSIGRTAPAGFAYVQRYSDYVLDGWEFGGACE